MSITTWCQHCGANAVRNEYIFRAEHSYTQFYCGQCGRAWAEHAGERRQMPEQHANGNRHAVSWMNRRKA
jgi:hypothetical protein